MNTSDTRLDQATHARIFADNVLPKSGLSSIASHDRPKAILLGGQPGSGKGGLARTALREFQGDILSIDPDELRDFHPNVEQLRATHPYSWSSHTQVDAGQWADELRDAAVAGKKNFIFDTTLSNGEWTSHVIKELQANGYDVEVRVVVAHKLESELGVDGRFSDSLDGRGFARYVPEAPRDAIYPKVPASLDTIHTQTDAQIRLYSRGGEEVYDSRRDARLPNHVLEQAREARLHDPEITRSLSAGWKQQQQWHERLPDTITENSKVAPDVAQRLLTERRVLHVVEGVQRDAAQATRLDYTVRVRPAVIKAAGIVGGTFAVVDAYTTAEQYQALRAQGNQFGADALLRRYEGRTAGGFIGSFAAGATYGLAAGSETGPGAFITGAIGGVVGAFAGDKIATMVNDHKVNHQTGTDGVTYAYENGHWSRTQHHIQLTDAGPANPYHAPNYTSTTTAAPSEQLSQLDYQRTTAITALALANPGAQDTKNIDLDGTKWHATREGWARPVDMPGVPNSFGIPAVITVDHPADARTSEQLNQIAANRQFNNDHYAEDVSKAYVMDYYGKGWNANGPLPDLVTKPLGLPSEQHIKDPVTGHIWNATGEGHFSREETRLIDKVVIRDTVAASGEERERLGQLQHSAVQSNAAYGKQLISQKFEESERARHFAHAARVDEQLPGPNSPGWHDGVSPAPPASFEDSARSRVAAPITPQSSNRDMFEAMMTATRNLDIDAMRSISQNYLQSPQGQAWLEQGQQFNRQQAVVQQQAMDAQQAQAAVQGLMR